MLEIRQMGKDYGQRPSDFIRGDNFTLSLDLIISRTGWKWEHEQHEKAKQKNRGSGWGPRGRR